MINPFQLPWPAEILADADAAIESTASTYDAITVLPGIGDVLRETWAAIRPQPMCDCPINPHHRWNCALTPIWAQTIRELDCNPWTVVRPRDLAMVSIRIQSPRCDICSRCFPWYPCQPDCHICWDQP